MQLRLHYNLAGCVITTSCTTRKTFGFKCYIHVYLPICVHYRSSQCAHVHLVARPQAILNICIPNIDNSVLHELFSYCSAH